MPVCNSGDLKLDEAVNNWLILDKNPDTRQEVVDYISHAQWEKLKKIMFKRLKFGTAGLRGRMGAGYTCMNDVVVLQTAQGLCSYMIKTCTKSQLASGLVIGYDGRYNSKRLKRKMTANMLCPYTGLSARQFFSESLAKLHRKELNL